MQMPTGTGKTIALLSIITSYQLVRPGVGKLIYCTRTVPEMEKAKAMREWQDTGDGCPASRCEGTEALGKLPAALFPDGCAPEFLAFGLGSRSNLCIHPDEAGTLHPSRICASPERDIRRPGYREVVDEGSDSPDSATTDCVL